MTHIGLTSKAVLLQGGPEEPPPAEEGTPDSPPNAGPDEDFEQLRNEIRKSGNSELYQK